MTEKTTTPKPAGAEKPANDATSQAKAAVEGAVKAGKDAATKNFGDALSRGRVQLDDLSKRYQSAVDDLVKYSRANLEAMMAVAGTVSSAAQDMSRSWYGFARQEAERGAEAAKAFMSAKTMQELFDLQSSYARRTLDAFVDEGKTLSELSLKATNDAAAPLNDRLNATAEALNLRKVA